MNTISPLLSINSPCERALQQVTDVLSQAGLRSMQTFDLHTARLGLHDCSCPNHGASACDCQMVVLLVYGDSMEPLTLILHGSDGRTWASVFNDPQYRVDSKLMDKIQLILEKMPSSDMPAE